MKTEELQDMTVDELQERYTLLIKELFNLRMQYSSGQLHNTSLIKKLKRDIARVLTIKAEKSRV